jgi:hypothetical protein
MGRLRSKATEAGVHLALSLQDIRDDEGRPCVVTKTWHRDEAERLAAEANKDLLNRDIRSVYAELRREERMEIWSNRIARLKKMVGLA